VIDYYPGNGLIGSLLARAASLPCTGLAFNNPKPSQIESFYDPTCFRMLEQPNAIETSERQAYFVSWTPSGKNPLAELLTHKPRLVIFVGTEHSNSETGERQVGVANMYQAMHDDYQRWDQWEVTRAENLLNKIWPDMTANIEETRQVQVYALKTIAQNKQDISEAIVRQQATPPYFWETELEMAELASEAMATLQRTPFGQ